jgi:hypothetical protein
MRAQFPCPTPQAANAAAAKTAGATNETISNSQKFERLILEAI